MSKITLIEPTDATSEVLGVSMDIPVVIARRVVRQPPWSHMLTSTFGFRKGATPMPNLSTAPELAVSAWLNAPEPLTLQSLRGRVVLLHAFQLLCPGCVTQSIPQVQRIERVFASTDLQIIGLHTVFEHHDAMSPVTLRAFLHEYRIVSPVGVDMADGQSPIPVTMRRYGFRGTPSSVLIGRDGAILHETFGVEDDLVMGARIAMALASAGTSQ